MRRSHGSSDLDVHGCFERDAVAMPCMKLQMPRCAPRRSPSLYSTRSTIISRRGGYTRCRIASMTFSSSKSVRTTAPAARMLRPIERRCASCGLTPERWARRALHSRQAGLDRRCENGTCRRLYSWPPDQAEPVRPMRTTRGSRSRRGMRRRRSRRRSGPCPSTRSVRGSSRTRRLWAKGPGDSKMQAPRPWVAPHCGRRARRREYLPASAGALAPHVAAQAPRCASR